MDVEGNPRDSGSGATWANTTASLLGTTVTLLAAAGISYRLLSAYYLYAIVGLETVAIFTLVFFWAASRRHAISLKKPRSPLIVSPAIYSGFFNYSVEQFSRSLAELRLGSAVIYGQQIRNAQVLLAELLMKQTPPSSRWIHGVDITTNPELWGRLGQFFKANEDLIKGGGSVRRVFIINDEQLGSWDHVRAVAQLMKNNEDIGVDVGACLRSAVDHEHYEDFINYGSQVVISESRQADQEFRNGKSYVFFMKPQIERFDVIFDNLMKGKTTSAKHFYKVFMKYVEEHEAGDRNFSIAAFLVRLEHRPPLR